jgi:hypothetical protein
MVQSPPIAAGTRGVELRVETRVLAKLAGRVVSPGGDPIPGVTVTAILIVHESEQGSDWIEGASTLTDAEGRFELSSVPAQHVSLKLDGDAILPLQAPVRVEANECTLVATRRCHFRIEASTTLDFDALGIESADGRELSIYCFEGRPVVEPHTLAHARGLVERALDLRGGRDARAVAREATARSHRRATRSRGGDGRPPLNRSQPRRSQPRRSQSRRSQSRGAAPRSRFASARTRRNSTTTGINDTAMIPSTTKWKLRCTVGMLPNKWPAPMNSTTHRHAADDVEHGEAPVAHRSDARDERRERPHDRDEARQDDRLAAVLLVEALRAHEVLLVEEARAFVREHLGADLAADPVVHRVADHGRDAQERRRLDHFDRRALGRRQRAHREEQ